MPPNKTPDENDERFKSAKAMEDVTKEAYDEEFKRKVELDEKSSNLMSTASTIATLYGGFGIITTTRLLSANLQINAPIVALLVGVTALILSISMLARSSFLKDYQYAINYDDFFKIFGNKIFFCEKAIDEHMDYRSEKLNREMIKNYLQCAGFNYNINEIKAKNLKRGQKIFFFGICSIPVFILLFVLQNQNSCQS